MDCLQSDTDTAITPNKNWPGELSIRLTAIKHDTKTLTYPPPPFEICFHTQTTKNVQTFIHYTAATTQTIFREGGEEEKSVNIERKGSLCWGASIVLLLRRGRGG